MGITESVKKGDSVAVQGRGVGGVFRAARDERGMTGDALASATGLCRRTIVKIEKGDESVAFGSYRAVARALDLDWLFNVFVDEGRLGSTRVPHFYLSGATALSLPQKGGGPPALWYSSSLSDPRSWRIAGKNLSDTTALLGVMGLWDASEILRGYGIDRPLIWAASPERATFDLLFHYCEVKRKIVPNIQASDLDDVVDLQVVSSWIHQCQAFLSPIAVENIRVWLEDGY